MATERDTVMADSKKTVRIGFINDFDGEDSDDNISALKTAAELQMSKGDTFVELHYIMDCGARRQYFQVMLGWLFSEENTLINGNAKCFFYLAPGVEDQVRREEVLDRMEKALGAGIDIDKYATEKMMPVDMFPWRCLNALVIAASQYGIPMGRIQEMPAEACIYMTGDRGSVNARPESSFDIIVSSSSKVQDDNGLVTSCPSRLILFPPVDPDKKSGYTRQCSTPGAYMTLFNKLANNGTNAFSANAVSLAESTRRSILDRPDNSRNAVFTSEDVGKYLLYQNGDVYVNGTKREIEWGSSPQPVGSYLSGLIKHVTQEYITLADHQYFIAPEGINRRRRITLSNQISLNNFIASLKPRRKKSVISVHDRENGIGTVTTQDALHIEVLAETIVKGIIKGHNIILLDMQDNTVTNLSSRLSAYSQKFIGTNVSAGKEDNIAEWNAVMNCLLGSLFLFGDVLCDEPEIKMDKNKAEFVIAEIQNPTYCLPDGTIRELTPNYDSCVVDTALQCTIHDADITNLNHVYGTRGEMIICNQSFNTVNAYRRRDEAHIEFMMDHAMVTMTSSTTTKDRNKTEPCRTSSCNAS